MEWLQIYQNGSLLKLYIQPGAARSEICGLHGERLKVKIKAPPRDGEANEELIEFIGNFFKISKSRVSILRGESSRQKDLVLELPLMTVKSLLSKHFEELK
ncbi:MAG: DUF167 domain-containing protein [Bacteriovoracaceae bacterium]